MKTKSLLAALACCTTAAFLSSCGSGRSVVYDITSANEYLGSLTKVTDNPEQTPLSLAVDPNSSTLFITMHDGRYDHIYKKENPLSAASTQLTSGDVSTQACAYNPANGRLAFTYQTPSGSYWTKSDIYMIDLKSINALIPVTQTATISEYRPSFSNDGKRLVYQANQGNSGEIWTKNLETNENILVGKGYHPSISGDGKKIVFCRFKNNNAYDQTGSVWIMDIDGNNVQQLTSADNPVYWPSFSPDGKRIVFRATKNKNNDLFIMNNDGTGLMQVTTNPSYEGEAVWSSDGYIYFISDRGGKEGEKQVWRFVAPN